MATERIVGPVRPGDASLSHTFELAQRVAKDRLRLLNLDLEARASSVVRRSTFISVGALCLLLAWIGLLGAAVFGLAERIALPLSLLAVALSQLVLGVALILWARCGGQRT
ncbi:MAG TPA: phage holin family protein [Myxococcota bacterium]|nr:phage holin family protein [Myxococcota bacterium]